MPRWKVKCKTCDLYLGRWPYNREQDARKVLAEHKRNWHERE